MKKIIIFDFDGVVVDSFDFCHRISNSISPVTPDEYRSRFEGNINDVTEKARAHLPKSAIDFSTEYFPEMMKCQPFLEVATAIKELAQKYMLTIISSTNSPAIDAFLMQHGLRECFADILGNDIDKSKVKKIQMVFEKYSVQAKDLIFITDTLGDIKEGNHCGVKSIAVTWGFQSRATLEKGSPYAVIDDKTQIQGEVDKYFKN